MKALGSSSICLARMYLPHGPAAIDGLPWHFDNIETWNAIWILELSYMHTSIKPLAANSAIELRQDP